MENQKITNNLFEDAQTALLQQKDTKSISRQLTKNHETTLTY